MFRITVSMEFSAFRIQTLLFSGISLPFFPGLCKYESSMVDLISTSTNINPNSCHIKCKNTNGCTAFAVDDFMSCVLYKGGPYTKGDGFFGIRCYAMQNSKCSCYKSVTLNID